MLLERDAELGQLDDCLHGVSTSGGKVVLVRGEAGIGKSSLIRAFIDRHADTTRVHVGACDDLLIPQPLAPFWDMGRDEAPLMKILNEGDRLRVFEYVLGLLSWRLRPSLMVIEDTQWADEATLDAIKFVGRRIANANGLLLLTYRDGEVDYDHPLRGVIGDIPLRSVARIRLSGLSLAAVASMIIDSDLDPDEVLAATNGNPFLIGEMESVDDGVIPASLHDTVRSRVRKLSPGAHRLLKALSVVPEPIPRADALGLGSATESWLDECEQRGFLVGASDFVSFRHDLIRRVVQAELTRAERTAAYRGVLEDLPDETHPCLLIHCAAAVNDIDRLIDLAPRSARYAAKVGSHRLAVEDFRQLTSHLDRLTSEARGPIVEEWAREEFLVDNIEAAIALGESAFRHYRDLGDVVGESRVSAQTAQFYEHDGQRERAELCARHAVDVLGANPPGADLARALEVNAYLQMMVGNVGATLALVEQTLQAGGPDIDEWILIRALNHRGIVANITNYPGGRASLDEASERARSAREWYEEGRALVSHAWAAAEFRDLPVAADYAQRAIASAVDHELPTLEAYAMAIHARTLEYGGEWTKAEETAQELLATAVSNQMVVLPVIGGISARKGRPSARATLTKAWEMSLLSGENQRLAPVAAAFAEYAWISDETDLPISDFKRVMDAEIERGFQYSPGSICFWLWKLGELTEPPGRIAEPYRLVMMGRASEAAAIWKRKGVPYEMALSMMHGDHNLQLASLEVFETLGASAVAAKLRKELRDQGVRVPRGRGRKTRGHMAGLTGRQAEVLSLLDENLSNREIADRLFLSPRTVENHVSAILAKLNSDTREEAVMRARAEGIVTFI